METKDTTDGRTPRDGGAFAGTLDADLAPGHIARLVGALLDSIDRGELDATESEIGFLRSVSDLLSPSDR